MVVLGHSNNCVMTVDDFVKFYGFCVCRHDVFANQMYAGKFPYSWHLLWVLSQGEKFVHLLEADKKYVVASACAGHDLIEDTRMTYNDVKTEIGEEVADIIYACTEVRGKNRAERHSAEFYNTLKANKIAVFVKLCDIIANVKFSILENSSMLDKYRSEYPHLKEEIYTPEFDEMFLYLEKLLAI